jgi:glutathione peroxidase
MKNSLFIMGILSFLTSCFVGKSKKIEQANELTPTQSIYDVSLKSLDGQSTINFADFKGKYVVVVNTASACGYTYQYENLQNFYSKYKDSNVVVIGTPCNQFANQESGTAEQIGAFCQKNYGVTFPMTEKIEVKGSGQHPLYAWLTKQALNGAGDFEVKWNFNKFVISPEGKLLHYFSSNTKPEDKEFLDVFGF